MKESAVESHLKQRISDLGGTSRKWVSPGHAGVTDQICFLPGITWFIEVKRTGLKPSGQQWREIITLLMLGQNAGYLAGFHEVNEFIDSDNRYAWMINHVLRNVDLDKLKTEQREWCELFRFP